MDTLKEILFASLILTEYFLQHKARIVAVLLPLNLGANSNIVSNDRVQNM